MSEQSEYKRGQKHAKEYFSKFTSFYKDDEGRIIARKKGGSTEVIGHPSQTRANKGFYGGAHKEKMKIIRANMKPKKSTAKSQSFNDLLGW